jgi:heat shock protein HslJ
MKRWILVTWLLAGPVAMGFTLNTAKGAGEPKMPAPTLAELRNAAYTGFEVHPGPVTLVDGRWNGKPFVAGGAARPSVTFVRNFRLVGDLNGDGAEEAVVLLGENSGGTGENIYLAVLGYKDGRLQQAGIARIGDRVQVRSARIEKGLIVMDLIQAGSNDAMCCPGELATRAWKLAPEGLTEAPSGIPAARLTADVLAGGEWVLRDWSWNEPAPAEPEVTLTYHQGRFTGSAGCNRYFASVKAGETPGEIRVGPAGSTRMSCADPAMAVEQRFLQQLAAVIRFGFFAGELGLSFEDGGPKVMVFALRPPRP